MPTRILLPIIAVMIALLPTQPAIATTAQAKLTIENGETLDRFGGSVAIDGDTLVVGMSGDDDNGEDSGAAYVFVRNNTTWTQQAKLIASDGEAYDSFGESSVAIDGDTIVVGARGDDDHGQATGAAYVFTRSGSTWSQQAKLIASDGEGRDTFGGSVAIDDDTIVVGAMNKDDYGWSSGSAYVFTRNGNSWTQEAKLTASDSAEKDYFGTSVAFSEDTVVVVASAYDENNGNSGSAYVMAKPSGITQISPSWAKRGKTVDVILTGTHLTEVSAISLGSGVNINNLTVTSDTRIVANITIAADATLGTRDVSITTPTINSTLPAGFSVEQGPPTITSVSISTASVSDMPPIITINGTNLTTTTDVNLGADIIVHGFTVNNDMQIEAYATVDNDATAGKRDVSVTTRVGEYTLVNALRISEDGLHSTTATGCRASAAAATSEAIASSWGLLGFLGMSGVYEYKKQKKDKTK